jgi:hypothetical protein
MALQPISSAALLHLRRGRHTERSIKQWIGDATSWMKEHGTRLVMYKLFTNRLPIKP